MIFPRAPKWINRIYRRRGDKEVFKVHGDINTGRVVAPVIYAMVDLIFVRTASWEVMCCMIRPMLFL